MGNARIPLVVTVALVAVAALAGCSEEKKSAAAKLPERSCFGVFSRSDLEPLVGPGDEVKDASPTDVRLNAERRGATCNIYVDGRGRVLVTATRQPLGQSFFWPDTGETRPAPEPLALGDKGRVWDTGATVALTCKGATDSFELELGIGGSVEHMKPADRRPLFIELMKKFLEVAKEQTRCGV
ncbi:MULTISPECIES: hypothetical protein [unclassified Streptomyces]|uniref:hypothetical protein n=1 Tax=unclassified Streptomyces TaxID=2593676 RepID=UPI00202FCECC|nr:MULTISPECIES: hypothetical protein [unclassified Streptomyces]MCM1967538.1 hypothetical protein [Streptomyces sp. G1]MCX5126040.1 hypothetical protein [Streptomyces sp. NBC_00347]MCX5298161.1 hypothetical protein [Streptomyces sp. NBC_00193]